MTGQGDSIGTSLSDGLAGPQAFDLNIEQVLEHWPVSFAIRELIANALDEQALTGSEDPTIAVDDQGNWHVRDFGRGLSYLHLTQKENPEKRENFAVIGQFGIGLKDALAVFDRHAIGVFVRSRHGDITTESRPKAGFADIRTLHGIVSDPSDRTMAGTDIALVGVTAADVAEAKSYFLRFSQDALLERTKVGEVLAKSSAASPGRIYVKGLLVAEEPSFLFSYNIIKLNAPLKRALNRERSNVGRTAYADRVKALLTECRSQAVAGPLVQDLAETTTGRAHDEIAWKDVAIHACRVLQSLEKVVFISPWETGSASVDYAKGDGRVPVVVPDDIAQALGHQTDFDGRPMMNLDGYRRDWNESFSFTLVDPADLTPNESAVHALTERVIAWAKVDLRRHGVEEILISETMRLNQQGTHQVLGVWEQDHHRIVIRRDQLASAAQWSGVLVHELAHAVSGATDGTLEFEDALTTRIGVALSQAIGEPPTST